MSPRLLDQARLQRHRNGGIEVQVHHDQAEGSRPQEPVRCAPRGLGIRDANHHQGVQVHAVLGCVRGEEGVRPGCDPGYRLALQLCVQHQAKGGRQQRGSGHGRELAEAAGQLLPGPERSFRSRRRRRPIEAGPETPQINGLQG